MRLTRFSDIGLRVLVYLERADEQSIARTQPVTVAEIAKQFDIPQNHLVKVVAEMAKIGWIKSTRGRNGGLRLAVLHPDRGEIDAVSLGFVEHGTFHHRDEAANTRPNTKRYGTFDTYCRLGLPPWEGAVTTGLRDAIEQYTAIWFPGAWTANDWREDDAVTPVGRALAHAALVSPR